MSPPDPGPLPYPPPLQEGHTAFATKEEANKEVLDILDLYR